jgi:CubicO group peptidase (beta-lactamase class C family)
MQARVLEPLGMSNSIFESETADAEHIVDSYAPDGSIAPHFRFTALAAASLYSSTNELTRFLLAHLRGPNGAPAGRGVLRPVTLTMMRERQASEVPPWGLGMSLVSNGAGGWLIGHDGGIWPGISTTARIDPSVGDGLIVLSSGDPALAHRVGTWWHEWRTGVALPVPLNVGALYRRAPWILGGSVVVVLVGVLGAIIVFRRTRLVGTERVAN